MARLDRSALDQGAARLDPPRPQDPQERIEVVPHRRRHERAHVVELEHVHVEVPDVARGLLQPAELRAVMRELVGGEYALEFALDRARAPHRHPQIVQELAVEVGDRAVEVRLDHLEHPAQHDRGGAVGALIGLERHAHLGREATRHAARSPDRFVDERLVGRLEAELADECLLHAAADPCRSRGCR